jgi:hypothetical protein
VNLSLTTFWWPPYKIHGSVRWNESVGSVVNPMFGCCRWWFTEVHDSVRWNESVRSVVHPMFGVAADDLQKYTT